MNAKNFFIPVLLAVLAASTGAQTAHVYDNFPGPAGGFINNEALPDRYACSTLYSQLSYSGPPFMGPSLGVLGGHAIDQDGDIEYVSDGPTIQWSFHPLYSTVPLTGGPCPTAGLPCGAIPPAVPLPFPHPTDFATGYVFGNITGMALSQPFGPCPKILWVTDGLWIMGLDPCPPYAVALPFGAMFPGPATACGNPLTGLECYPPLGVLIACDQDGHSYLIGLPLPCSSFLTGSSVHIFNPPAPLSPLCNVNTIVGNVLDRSLPGLALWLVPAIGPMVNVFPGNLPLTGMPPPLAGHTRCGASFSAEPSVLHACSGGTPTIAIGTTEPIVLGKTLNVWMRAPSLGGTTAFLSMGPCWNSGPFDCNGCQLWIDLLAWSLYGPFPVPLSGDLCVSGSISSTPSLVGATTYLQWIAVDFNSSCGGPIPFSYFVSDALHCRVSTL